MVDRPDGSVNAAGIITHKKSNCVCQIDRTGKIAVRTNGFPMILSCLGVREL